MAEKDKQTVNILNGQGRNIEGLSKTMGDSGDIVEETKRIFDLYKKKRYDWEENARKDQEYRLGRQWTDEQIRKMESRGQAPVVVNRIHPAVETAKALLTANRPAFKVSPREDSDVRVAAVINQLLTYMYDISDGKTAIRQAIDDYYVCGMGYIQIYQNPSADDGKGEVMMKELDPMDVYVDPNSRSRYFDDAENIVVSKLFTKDQAKRMYPDYVKAIQAATGDMETDEIMTGGKDDIGITFPGQIDSLEEDDYIRGYERYTKIYEIMYRIFQRYDKKEYKLSESEWQQYLEQEVGLIGDKVLEKPQDIKRAQEAFAKQREEQVQQATQQIEVDIEKMREELLVSHEEKKVQLEEAVLAGSMIEERMALELEKGLETIEKQVEEAYQQAMTQIGAVDQIPNVQILNKAEMIKAGMIEAVPVRLEKVKMCVVLGDTYLYSRILPTSDYPIVPLVNLHTRTPYPLSDVRMVRGLQDYINKTRSLIIAHATTSTNMKVLVPAGSVDMKEFEEKWAQPGVGIEVDFDMGQPVVAQPTPLPNELYTNEQTAKSDIDHQLGLYEMMMGNSQAAPQTYKATISLDEFGQRKIKSKLSDVEACLTRVGKIGIQMMQELYQYEKIFRVINPNNSLSEYVVNKKLVDMKDGEIETVTNDITVGKYDCVFVSGSTLPSNRYAELEFYMEAYKSGIVDKQEVLKKTEIFDMEGVMERTDIIGKLEQQLNAVTEELKKHKGDMQTLTRENVHLKQKIEVEKFKTGLDKVKNKADASNTIFEKRLDDTLSMAEQELRDAKQERAKLDSASKSTSKKKGK